MRMRWTYIRWMRRARSTLPTMHRRKQTSPQMGVKLLHARLEMSGDRESLIANLRVLLPDEGLVTVEW